MVAYKSGEKGRLVQPPRAGPYRTIRGPRKVPRRVASAELILDGEVAVFDKRLVFAIPRLAGSGHEAWAEVQELGLEGFVGNDQTSTCRSGGQTRLDSHRPLQSHGKQITYANRGSTSAGCMEQQTDRKEKGWPFTRQRYSYERYCWRILATYDSVDGKRFLSIGMLCISPTGRRATGDQDPIVLHTP